MIDRVIRWIIRSFTLAVRTSISLIGGSKRMFLDYDEVHECARLLCEAKKTHEVFDAWIKLGAKFPELSGVVHLDDYHSSVMPNSIKKYTKKPNEYLISYYLSDSLYFIDDAMARDILNHGKKDFAVDYSIMFDSNMASYINRLVQGKGVGDKKNNKKLQEKVLKVVDDILRDDLNFDFIFYMLENLKSVIQEANFNTTSKLKFWMSLNKDLRDNIVNLHFFSSIDSELYKRTLNPRPVLSYRESARNAVDASFDFYSKKIGKEQGEQWALRQKIVLLNLIGALRIQFSSNKSTKNKMSEYFDFIHNVVGTYMDREALIVFNYFSSQKSLTILNKVHKGCKKKGLLKHLDNIAWDMIAPRYMEKALAYSPANNSRYFIPYFLSFDEGLRDMLNQYKVKATIYDRETSEVVSFSEVDSYDFYKQNGLEGITEKFFSDESRYERESRDKLNRITVHKLITDEYRKLKKLTHGG